MAVLITCESGATGQVALLASNINGLDVPERRYEIVNSLVTVDHWFDAVVAHDAAEILAISGFRLATANEQTQEATKKVKQGKVTENGG